MSDLGVLLDRHRVFAESFDAGDLRIPPQLSTVILTCIDTRLEPAHLFGLDLGDALVLRNAGGRVTPGVLRDLAVLTVLSGNWPEEAALELVVIHHTDCGMQRLANPDAQQQVADRLGVPVEEIARFAINDPTTSVREDVELFRRAIGSKQRVPVTGLVYDVAVGTLTKVTRPRRSQPPESGSRRGGR